VFEGTEPIFEKRIADGRIRSYVYALGKHLARVDGVIGDASAKVYYYHTDHLGSIKAVTDQSGQVVFNADYKAFGSQFAKDGDFDETHGFTGKEYDSDTGLYYYDARWYDSETGRFISEDPVGDPNNPNLYSYCANNPLTNTDPTGLDVGWYGETNQGGNSGYNDGKYNWSGSPSSSGSSGNNKDKKSFWDTVKSWWDSYQKYCDNLQKEKQERAAKKAEDFLAQRGITKDDPDYNEKLNNLTKYYCSNDPFGDLGAELKKLANALGISEKDQQALQNLAEMAVLTGGFREGIGGLKGPGNKNFDSLPENVKDAFNKYDENNWDGNVPGQTPGTKAGSTFQNRDGKLPTTDSTGKSITYKEHDVNNKVANQGRDSERFVSGSDGSVYYTNDHYNTFTKVK
jgi:RHS repeat-associated protein